MDSAAGPMAAAGSILAFPPFIHALLAMHPLESNRNRLRDSLFPGFNLATKTHRAVAAILPLCSFS